MQIVNSLKLLRGAGRHTRLTGLAFYPGPSRAKIPGRILKSLFGGESLTLNDILLWVAAGGAVLACLLASRPACARPPAPPAWTRCSKGWNAPSARCAPTSPRASAACAANWRSRPAPCARAGAGQDELRAGLGRDAQAARAESAESLARFAAGFGEQLQGLIQINERRLSEVRATVDQRLQLLQADNGAKLDEMRRTVDESCTPRWNSGWANRSSWSPSGWRQCTRAWAKCRRWPPAWAISSAC